jgi:glycosyltransferase involved in cell wall biosynthesis
MPLKVAWISDFPVERLPDVPKELQQLPRYNATWQRVLLEELIGARAYDLDIHVISVRKQFRESSSFQWRGVTFHLVKAPGSIRGPSLFWVDTLLLRPLLKKFRPDLVHAWGTEKGAALVAQRLGYPYLVTIQGLITWYREQIPLNRYERFGAWLEDRSLPKAPLVTTESKFAVQFLENRFANLRVRQAEHAPNWLFHQVTRKPQSAPVRFVFVGSFGYRKGGDLLVRSLDALKGEFVFQLQVLGSVEAGFIEKLRTQTSKGIWERVQFRHDLKAEEIANELAQATMMIFPTRADTSPNAVKEAVVAGLPVLGSNIGGIPDYVFPGKNGLIFAPDSVDACVEAIRSAFSHPLFREGKVDEMTLAKTREYLSPKVMAEKFVAAYREVLKT